MLNGDGNENGKKINRSTWQKTQFCTGFVPSYTFYCAHKNFAACVPVRHFFTAAHFHLDAR